MSVWICCPSARPIEQVLAWAAKWKARGYSVAVWRDNARDSFALQAPGGCDLVMFHNDPYPGYAVAANNLVKQIMLMHADAEWFIIAGDDVYPDANHAAWEIAAELGGYFMESYHHTCAVNLPWSGVARTMTGEQGETFGAMQPTGDRWGENSAHHNPAMHSAYIDRVCGSAWLGREFCARVNRGNGPLWPAYRHMFVDEELFNVAQRLGVLWQRRDLIHYHDHPGRKSNYNSEVDAPPHMKPWITSEHWREAEALFKARRAAGFPGTECL